MLNNKYKIAYKKKDKDRKTWFKKVKWIILTKYGNNT